MKNLLYSVFAIGILAGCVTTPNKVQEYSADQFNGIILPYSSPGPIKPQAAIEQGIEGWVELQFTVTETGAVDSIKILDRYPVDNSVFDRAAIESLSKWKYRPVMVGGSPVRMSGMKRLISFGRHKDKPEPLPIVRVEPIYPQIANSQIMEGSVTLSYTVTSSGTVTDVEIVERFPKDISIFDEASIEALQKWKYVPAVIDGKPAEVKGMITTLTFKLADSN